MDRHRAGGEHAGAPCRARSSTAGAGQRLAGGGPSSLAHDTVLAATMPAFLETPGFPRPLPGLDATQSRLDRAGAGGAARALHGWLPALGVAWRGRNPGVDIVLRGLSSSEQPDDIAFADWTFTAVVPDIAALATYLADRLDWPAADARRLQMAAHLAAQAKRGPAGDRLEITRKSAVLVWGKP